MKLRLITCLLIAFTATSAFAQSKLVTGNEAASNTTVLPLWNTQNGQVDALLLIEPSVLPQLPSQRIIRPAGNASAATCNCARAFRSKPIRAWACCATAAA